jgi:UDP-N-acetylglucosamine--N-acetylmuramyl-(pentapeptide) pyrophosphoryl-undecaprenol N-acetylglucosamine transferase
VLVAAAKKINYKKEVNMPLPETLRVIISGGGTGGHVFPAIAIANAIKEMVPNVQILFVGAKGRMEMQKVPAAGYHIIGFNIAGLQRKLTLKNLSVPFKLIDSMIRSKNIVKRFKPHVVIGVGGYASGPLVRAAAKQGVPTLIQEQNSYPGITNKLLAGKADKICVAYEGMERFFPKEKLFLTGNPVRNEVLQANEKKQEGLTFFGFSEDRKVLLIVGGSLGAFSINEAMSRHIGTLVAAGIQVIWQTGKTYYEKAAAQVSSMNTDLVRVSAFIDRMDLAYGACDMIVSRAGAIAISEICALQRPSILVPSPYVTEDHQTKNALALVNMQAAVLLTDNTVGDKIADEVLALLGDEDKLNKLKQNIARLYYRDSARNIANIALNLIK